MQEMRGKVDVGDEAPGFRAQDVTYHDINSADYRGRNSLALFFYRDGRCQVCREELAQLAKRFDDIVRLGGDVIAIGTEGFVAARDLALELHLPFHVVSDPDGRIARDYGVCESDANAACPALFLIGENGVVRYRKIVREAGDVMPADKLVDRFQGMGPTHGESVISSVRLD